MDQQNNAETLDRQSLVQLVRKWGGMNTDGVLDYHCKHFTIPNVEGFIGYRHEGSNAVVFGDPICDPHNKPTLALAFQEYCKKARMGVVYAIASEEFSNWGVENLSGILIEFGQKFILNPMKNPLNNTGSKAVLVRKKIKQAFKDGAVAHEYTETNPLLEKEIEAVANAWLHGRKGPQIYLSHVQLFDDKHGKRWFYAEKDGRVVGFLVLNALQSHQGWLLNHVMIVADAPRGVSELLIITALETLEKENCEFVLVGPTAAHELGKIKGLSKIASLFPRFIYSCAMKVFKHLTGQEIFWEKFHPIVESTYLLFPKKNLTPFSIKSLFQALNVSKN